MIFRCSHSSCFQDIPCALGHTNRSDCEHWVGEGQASDNDKTSTTQDSTESTRATPWNGYVMGTHDLAILGGRGRPAVIGLIGPPDSGKTSLLAYLYMWLLEHGAIGEWGFAGSWTLGGWESIVQHSRWTSAPPPSFPPHTSSAGRHPGILHLALRNQMTGYLRDLLLTDAPGEWFVQWARVPDSAAAEGARWVIERSDTLLLLVDSDALADKKRLSSTRRATRDLMERVGAQASCTTAIVWTKSDIDTPKQFAETIETTSSQSLPSAKKLQTTTTRPETIEACFNWALDAATSCSPMESNVEPRFSNDPFLAFRRTYGRP